MEHSIARQIRDTRQKLGLTQEQLAEKLKVSFATVNRWEGGKAKPQKTQLDALGALFEEAGIGEDSETSELPFERSDGRKVRRGGLTKSEVLSNKSMEQMLWDAACKIRGEKDAPKFKDYILPILFMKRLSDVFDDEVIRLADQFDDREVALEVLEADHSLVRFYLPPEARWAVVSGRERFDWPEGKEPKTVGEQLTSTIRAIVKHNPKLAGVIDIVDFNETRNGEREISDGALKKVIETFSDPRYRLGLHDVEPDFLGRCYEYLLRKFAEGQGQSAGEFFTPTEVGILMAEIMRPRPGEECYDYACGSFGLLIKLQLVCRRLDPLSKVPLRLYGQELTGSSYAIACMNKIIHDMEGEVLRGDSMRNPKFRDTDTRLKRFDIVVSNPMWNQPFDSQTYENDPFGRFEEQGGMTTSKADWAWLQHTLATMKDTGRAAVVLDTGAVARSSEAHKREVQIRKWFVERDYVDGVILLPDNLFYNTPAAGVILVLRKNKPKDRRGKITLINASREFYKGAPKNYLPDDVVRKIADAFHKSEPVPGFCAVVTTSRAAESDFNLSPGKYLADGSERNLRSLAELSNELSSLTAEQQLFDAELTAALPPLLKILNEAKLTTSSPWPMISFPECLDVLGIEKPRKILARNYKKAGSIPVVDQGQELIAGWTDDQDAAIRERLPFVVFGDHTRIFKYVDFPFALGADGTQLLKPKPDFNPRFFYYACLNLSLPSRGYNRHFSLLKEYELPQPSKPEQEKIAALLRKAQLAPFASSDEAKDKEAKDSLLKIDRRVGIYERKRATLQELFKTLLHQLMTGQIRVDKLDIDVSEVV